MLPELAELLKYAGTAAGRLDSIQLAGSEKLIFPASLSWKGKTDRPTDGRIAEFVATLTTSREDREGDVLESAGAQLDPAAPLLFNHDRAKVVGKLVGTTEQTPERLRAKWAIASTPLGHDVATLAEFGALRMSHGFQPKTYEPRRGKQGYHIKEFLIYEGSLVAVPCNVDARLEVFERIKSFQSHEFQAMRADILRSRPAVVRSGFSAQPKKETPMILTPALRNVARKTFGLGDDADDDAIRTTIAAETAPARPSAPPGRGGGGRLGAAWHRPDRESTGYGPGPGRRSRRVAEWAPRPRRQPRRSPGVWRTGKGSEARDSRRWARLGWHSGSVCAFSKHMTPPLGAMDVLHVDSVSA